MRNSRDRGLPAEPVSIRKAQSRKKSPHTFAHLVNFSKYVSAMFDNRTILLFWLYNEQTFRMFSLRNLPFLLCSLDLDVLRAQRIIGVFILITHKSTGSQNPITWSTSEPRSFTSFHKQVQEEFMVLNPRPFNIGHRQ